MRRDEMVKNGLNGGVERDEMFGNVSIISCIVFPQYFMELKNLIPNSTPTQILLCVTLIMIRVP